MTIQESSVIHPLPTLDFIQEKERKWRLVLPDDFKDFIMQYNGGIPDKTSFICCQRGYTVTRFLCILKNPGANPNGWYDISVVESQIGERLTSNEDLMGVEILPIAALSGGDYLCLDFRNEKTFPEVCVWCYEESEDFSPVTYKAADTFSAFLGQL